MKNKIYSSELTINFHVIDYALYSTNTIYEINMKRTKNNYQKKKKMLVKQFMRYDCL